MEESDDGQYDYLFDDDDNDASSDTGVQQSAGQLLAQLTDLLASTPLPPTPFPPASPTHIPGFHLYRAYLPSALLPAYHAWLTAQYFHAPDANQAMHFGALLDHTTPLGYLAHVCRPLRQNPHAFDQAIMNMYGAGEGIGDHVDLRRFMDGICGVSFGAPAVMRLARVTDGARQERYAEEAEGEDALYVEVRPGDVYVLEGEARWRWTHGFPRQIDGRDNVMDRRISITLRTLEPDE
ncbi:hypothetical protein LPJ53_003257 [Coemansia erecta]|uniref:Alpha-ketoglutarate-dependent dioxygenase AlkB-like domain-containing protein n=1 Tax=Coemansia erecta TaxID=147472 RepID=A0A9W8CSY4_9FUNG|nr:hypothetical protein LPJ53_003257 [Coemansia erecta]